MGRSKEEKRRKKIREEKESEERRRRCTKSRKVAQHCVFQMSCGSGRSKSRLARAAGAEPSGGMRDEKLRTGVARSTFLKSKVWESVSWSHNFWKLTC